MKYLYYLIFIFFLLGCQAQEDQILIIQNFIDSNNLTVNSKINFLNAKKISKDDIISIYKYGFANKVDKNTNKLEWPLNFNQLENIKPIDENLLWNQKDFNLKLFENTDDSLKKLAKKLVSNEATLISISNVYFDESKTYALFSLGQATDLNVSERYVIVLAKRNDKWKVVNKIVDNTLY